MQSLCEVIYVLHVCMTYMNIMSFVYQQWCLDAGNLFNRRVSLRYLKKIKE